MGQWLPSLKERDLGEQEKEETKGKSEWRVDERRWMRRRRKREGEIEERRKR
jgi:hypothetical protein